MATNAACESLDTFVIMISSLLGTWDSIHDPDLLWVPPLERTSGRSTPSSSTLSGNKSGLPDKVAIDVVNDSQRSVSSKSAHCWGYIQGICPHSDSCRYLHPADIVPCGCFFFDSQYESIDLMLTNCRYKIHTVPHLAALRLPSP